MFDVPMLAPGVAVPGVAFPRRGTFRLLVSGEFVTQMNFGGVDANLGGLG